MKTKNLKTAKKGTGLIELHRQVIDEYFLNGFNAVNAVLKFKPEVNYNAAANLGRLIINSDKNKTYIQGKREEIRKEANTSPEELVNELKQIAFNDPTQYLGLNESEIKQLSPASKRAIKKVSIKEKQYRYKDGSQANEKTITIEAHDKLKALQEIGKIIGIYAADNKQKQTNINLTKLDIGTLNNILQAIDSPAQKD